MTLTKSGIIHGVVGGVVSGTKTSPPPTSTSRREDITTILDYTGVPAPSRL